MQWSRILRLCNEKWITHFEEYGGGDIFGKCIFEDIEKVAKAKNNKERDIKEKGMKEESESDW